MTPRTGTVAPTDAASVATPATGTRGRPSIVVDPRHRRRRRIMRALLHTFLIVTALLWLLPIVLVIYVSFRPYDETALHGFFTWPDVLTLDNYRTALDVGEMTHHYWITFLIVVPALFLVLLLSSMVAFAVSRFSWRFNIALLVLFTAGNLLPQQVIIQPLFQMYNRIPLPTWLAGSGELRGSIVGLILIHVAFQSGFCVFVLSNYMKTLPRELNEAAMVDGAGVVRQFFQIILPLTRPALAALATLEFTWIYNDFFWAVVLVQRGADRPITSSLANLGGQFFTDNNLVAAGSVLVALPTLIVYLVLQRQFIGGLSLGASKG